MEQKVQNGMDAANAVSSMMPQRQTGRTRQTEAAARNGNTRGAKDVTSTSYWSEAVSNDIRPGMVRVSRAINWQELGYASEEEALLAIAAGEETAEGVVEKTEDKKKKESEFFAGEGQEFSERLLESMKESREAQKKKRSEGTKRRLNYSYRKVSGAIMRAKNSMQAGNALTSAKANLSTLQRKAGSKNYDSNELTIAISHAKKMVRTAKKKVNNIRFEERNKQNDDFIGHQTDRRKKQIVTSHQEFGLSESAKLEKEVLRIKKQLKREHNFTKNAHRRDENMELLMADLEYLRKRIDYLKNDSENMSQSTSSTPVAAEGTTVAQTGATGVEGAAAAQMAAQTGAPAVPVSVPAAPAPASINLTV